MFQILADKSKLKFGKILYVWYLTATFEQVFQKERRSNTRSAAKRPKIQAYIFLTGRFALLSTQEVELCIQVLRGLGIEVLLASSLDIQHCLSFSI